MNSGVKTWEYTQFQYQVQNSLRLGSSEVEQAEKSDMVFDVAEG